MTSDYDTVTAMLTRACICWSFDLKEDGTIEVDVTAGPGGPNVDAPEPGWSVVYRFSGTTHAMKGLGIYE